ncbi:MAG TPA: mechanosensitive ion channel domain-containing protein [Steroidobacteraceae bacterium]|nr:mechanosensitive ion channel domain-containing protein [Steroidobacteraceae bacterium]
MRPIQKTTAFVLLAALVGAGYGIWATYQPPPPELGRQEAIAHPADLDSAIAIDERTLRRAQRLGALATTPEEAPLAQQAAQLADHELDVTFAAALRQIEAHPPVLSPEAQKISDRLQKSQKQLDGDQAQVEQLTAALAQAPATQKSALQDRVDLAQSQLELDKDEVAAANRDLMQAGGNVHQRIQKMMQDHTDAANSRAAQKPAAADPLAKLHGLAERLREWLALRKKQRYLQFAAAQAGSTAAELMAEGQKLAAQLEAGKSARSVTAGAQATSTGAQNADLLTTTRQLVADQKLLSSIEERVADRKQLAEVYGKWNDVVGSQATTVLHAGLMSITTVIVILIALLFVDQWLERIFGRMKLDRRQVETLRSVARVSLQIVGIVVILLLLIGVPTQLGTMLGIVGAGLTVALKDFIVAFIGWLVLMGKNGMRLGDWVEINGVSGEVVELGMFHTVLLETGNWTDAGHPTGRRVTFTNSFAISGHYFNFSTSGQWLWDEVLVLVPYERDPHPIADTIYKEVVDATRESSKQAETEWKGGISGKRGAAISATPGLSIRPAVGGVEVAVRYVTRASERFNLRARLYESAVEILGHPTQASHAPAAKT